MIARTMDIRVADNGRMVLPRSVREAMGLHGESRIILMLENDEVRLTPVGHGIARACALYRDHASANRTTDHFLADRRAEAVADTGGLSGERTAQGTP